MKLNRLRLILCTSTMVAASAVPAFAQSFLQAPLLPPQGGFVNAKRACCNFDGDAFNDLVAVETGGIAVMMGNENGSLRPGQIVAAGNFAGVDCCDVDGDGEPDIVASAVGLADILLFINTSSSGFPSTAPGTTPVTGVAGSLRSLQCCDLDYDGDNDVLAFDATNLTLLIWENCLAQGCAPTAPFLAPQVTNLNKAPFVVGSVSSSIVCCDISESTQGLDVIVAQVDVNGNSTVTFCQNYVGIGSFRDGAIVPLINPSPTIAGVTFDMVCCDADGLNGSEVFIGHGGTVSSFVSQGPGFAPSGPFTIGTLPGNVLGMDCCDVDGDGVVEIVTCARASGNSLHIVSSSGGATVPFAPQPAGVAFLPRCCDIDVDGGPEVIVDQANGAVAGYLTFVNQLNTMSGLTYPGSGGPLVLSTEVSPSGIAGTPSGGPLADVKSAANGDTVFVTVVDLTAGAAGQFVFLADLFNTSLPPAPPVGGLYLGALGPQPFDVGTGAATVPFLIPASLPPLNGFSFLLQSYAVVGPQTITTSAAHEIQMR